MERFPPLYREADRAADYFKGKGGIEKWMVDEAEKQDAAARMIVLDNKVSHLAFWYRITRKGFPV